MNRSAHLDEQLLIDYLTGQLSEEQVQQLRARLEKDETLRRRLDDVQATFQALDLHPEPEPPEDLAERTLAKIAAVERTNALLAMQQTGARRGTFSLKELTAVAAMLLVMAGILAPALHKARQRGDEGLCAMQMGQIGNALQTFAINHEGHLPSTGVPLEHWLTRDDAPPASNSRALFRLLQKRYLPSPVVFQCPSVGGASFAFSSDMEDFPQSSHISYSYQYSLDDEGISTNDPAVADNIADLAILADQTPLFVNGVFRADCLDAPHSENHSDGQNVLYLDGHVLWVTRSTVGVGGDHIFLVGDVQEYRGNECPASPTDSFLLPAHGGE
ncbi:MAG: hypothetical protein JXA11_02250 [Phycisphaerae bacterium]|nr:hypothetical protein [Phycisphaerae bacterium]